MYIAEEKIARNEDGRITQVQFTLGNGTVITAEACYESWQQWGGSTEELYVTMPRLEELNAEFARDDD